MGPQDVIGFVQINLSIHTQDGLKIRWIENAPAILLQAPFEFPDAISRKRKTCRLRVTPEPVEEVARPAYQR